MEKRKENLEAFSIKYSAPTPSKLSKFLIIMG